MTCRLLVPAIIIAGVSCFAQWTVPEFHARGSIVPGRVVVGFKTMPDASELQRFCSSVGTLEQPIPQIAAAVIRIPDTADPVAVASELSQRPEVAYAEPDTYVELAMIPNDPLWANEWDKVMIGAPAVWDMTLGDPDTLIAFTDTGVLSTHEDLVGQLIPGWNTVLNNNDTTDDAGHGTCVTGTCAPIINNNLGLAGLAPKCKYVMVKVLVKGVGTASNVADGLTWAVDAGARVVSISLTGVNATPMYNAVEYAHNKGTVVCAAAGNDNNTAVNYPAGYTHVIPVAASNSSDNRGYHSSYGSWVTIAAPGENVWTTEDDGTYGYLTGTSMASPIVAGEAGLIYGIVAPPGVRSTALADQVRAIIEANVVPKSWVKLGRIDAAAAVLSSYVTISGNVSLEQWSPGPSGVQLTLSLRSPGTTDVVETQPVTLDSNGNYTGRFKSAGTYDVVLTGGTWLAAGAPAQALVRGSNSLSFTMLNGDVSQDNGVGFSDMSLILADWGQGAGAVGDCTGDGNVGFPDLNCVLLNFGLHGF